MKIGKLRWLLMLGVLALIGTQVQAAPVRYWPQWKRADGQTKDGVKSLQYLLRARGYTLGVDGIYGNQTASQIKRFQRARKLRVSGEMNEATWEALVKTVRRGSRGDAVRAVQRNLQEMGYKTKVDGVFGFATERDVRAFQKDQGRTVDGVVGAYTWCSLVGGDVIDPH